MASAKVLFLVLISAMERGRAVICGWQVENERKIIKSKKSGMLLTAALAASFCCYSTSRRGEQQQASAIALVCLYV